MLPVARHRLTLPESGSQHRSLPYQCESRIGVNMRSAYVAKTRMKSRWMLRRNSHGGYCSCQGWRALLDRLFLHPEAERCVQFACKTQKGVPFDFNCALIGVHRVRRTMLTGNRMMMMQPYHIDRHMRICCVRPSCCLI